MKKKGTELKDLTVVELQDKLEDARTKLSKLRFDHAVSPVESPMQLRLKRKEVARVLTELRARELNVNKK
ncbi:MAG: 50S ribosomal protein L29 [Flavobacteriales bacterium]|jgi:large subunit ribosomal protein L29|nr:50S ribosomal protein L29 [Flavobacteriales bacterium]MBK7083634.1 50S ribosomal protein L29 [Flavobacteriales bacterium]MBK7753468.1 50S ribosomal protein L29 [Flavobacteriales bacterium]MBK9077096.1 50S ribosomal protein L29 [Flavobacteriales bacterium]MBK9538516.1 50S ribosomal protein L29 [Flavobacteriales bacterium]